MSRIQSVALGSIAVGVLVLAIKYAAYAVTGSVALLSDALESIVNVATALAAFVALRIAMQPADAKHPYGHSKAEYLAAVVEGVLIVVAACAILREAYNGFVAPAPLGAPLMGLAISAVATGINAAWSVVLMRQGRAHRSVALEADGKHLLTDVISSLGVIVGVALVFATGIAMLDAVLAVLVALNVLWAGWHIMRDSVGGLMDEAVPEAMLGRVRELIATNAEGAVEAHDIKTRRAGKMTFIEFHLVVASDMTVTAAHDICDRLERALRADIPDSAVSIHVEPETKAKHSGIVVL
ncbi:cation diffusion facilitator family transporter [Lichenihabitans sp. Uapishka_5]|uniref:cation diffusion facilitator family transporter n=1 Tax=Lichenihabitans sp. Uapishka_5 TaxID=3037302 RepID=UPI0029E7D33D|nr:cation diffusion facilitator family transporter [Lichenihabitans sp. Uapishka_5]MDX7949877.1 cation diffusion facilitator family transporter [Lichenihabitans sp. Uapishka_5]